MNIRKPVDYSAMYAALDNLMSAGLPQMKLYSEIGRVINTRMEKGAAVMASFSSSQKNLITKFVKKCCGTDLELYGEFWGSSILCMQDPILWEIKSFGRNHQGQQILLLLPRDGKDVEGMHYAIRSHHSFGIIDGVLTRITSECLSLKLPDRQSKPELIIWDQKGRMLECRPLVFFGSIGMSTTTRRMLPDGRSVAVWPNRYYSPREKSRLEQYEELRMYKMLERRREFFYFKAGEQTRARSVLGELLASGGREIVICDMYLDTKGFDESIKGWVRCERLILVTSKNWMEQAQNPSGTSRITEIKQRVSDLIKNGSVKSALLLGITRGSHRDGSVHDRFFIVDGIAYCVGSSLNGFGGRDTVLFRSPNPKAFLDRVEEWKLDTAKVLQTWGTE